MNKAKMITVIVVLLTVLVGAALFLKSTKGSQSGHRLAIETAAGEEAVFFVEYALTPKQQEYGLMNRSEMAHDHGMLFVFPEAGEKSFYMKNTLIPLDMIFIRTDGTIHRIHKNAIPNDLTSIPSYGDVSAVLEINGGQADANGIAEGDKVISPFFRE